MNFKLLVDDDLIEFYSSEEAVNLSTRTQQALGKEKKNFMMFLQFIWMGQK